MESSEAFAVSWQQGFHSSA